MSAFIVSKAHTEIDTHRNAVIERIRTALRARSGRPWSVTGGRGTAYGWITITVPPARRTWRYRLRIGQDDLPGNYEEYNSGQPGGHMGPDDRAALAHLLGLAAPVHFQGVSIPAGHDYYREYVDRAEGREPVKLGTPYWD